MPGVPAEDCSIQRTLDVIGTDATALIKQVAELCDAPEQIESVRENLHHIKAISPEEMVTAYNRLCPRPH